LGLGLIGFKEAIVRIDTAGIMGSYEKYERPEIREIKLT
jgi:hypothetical protein